MSGFEIAGIVLGSIPLLITTLENYSTGLSTLQRWRKYEREIQSLIRNLRVEKSKIQNVCEKLLDGIVPDSRIDALINNPMGDPWKETDTLEKVHFRLGRDFEIFEATVKDLREELEKMSRRIDSQGEGAVPGLRRAVFTLNRSQYADLLSNIRDNVSNLENLTDRNMELEPARKVRSKKKLLAFLRGLSESLYRALRSSLICSCEHEIGLGLESRTSRIFSLDSEEKMMSFSSFTITISYQNGPECPTVWEEIIAQPRKTAPTAGTTASALCSSPLSKKSQGKKKVSFLDSPESMSHTNITAPVQSSLDLQSPITYTTTSRGISPTEHLNLCDIIKNNRGNTTFSPYGTITDELPFESKEFSLSPYHVLQYEPTRSLSIISLRDILEQQNQAIHLPVRDRHYLAVVTASSMLQLRSSPWLPDHLNSHDIFFFKYQGYPIYSKPFLKRHLSSTDTSSGSKKTFTPPFTNPALWSLGLLLIELILGRTIDSARTREDSSGLPAEYFAAYQLLDEVRMVSLNYGTAVTRCLGGELHNTDYSSGSADFCQDVYAGVVALLEEDLENS